MKEIKTKEVRRVPKLRDPVSRMPRELMRNAVLEAKEKSAGHYGGGASGDKQESPTEYLQRHGLPAGQPECFRRQAGALRKSPMKRFGSVPGECPR